MKIFVKPAVEGNVIRHPEKMQHILPKEGEWVEDSVIWQRKIMQGDVLLVEKENEFKTDIKPQVKNKFKEEKINDN